MRGRFCIVAVALLGLAASSALAGEAPGRAIPDGKTSRGCYFSFFFNTQTLKVEGLAVDWGCRSVDNGKPTFSILTHKGIGSMPATGRVSLTVSLPYTKLGGEGKALGNARVTVTGAFRWGSKSPTKRAIGSGTVVVTSAHCTTGTLTYSVREH